MGLFQLHVPVGQMDFTAGHGVYIKLSQLRQTLVGNRDLLVQFRVVRLLLVISPFFANGLVDSQTILGRVRLRRTEQLLVELQESFPGNWWGPHLAD